MTLGNVGYFIYDNFFCGAREHEGCEETVVDTLTLLDTGEILQNITLMGTL